MVLMVLLFVLGAAWLVRDLPAVLSELRHLVRDWAAVHEVVRRVDCRPWGLERTFVISQDLATTSPAKEPVCSWAPVPGRKWEFGLSLWSAAFALARLLCEQRAELSQGAFKDGRTVIELGCGQALVSMVAAALFPGLARIVATDGSEDVLRSARTNVATNLPRDAEILHLLLLRWGCREHERLALELNAGKAYDVVLAADVTYMEECSDLVSSILALSHSETEAWVLHEPRRRSASDLEARLRDGFSSVTHFEMELTAQDIGRDETVRILGWHCIGKAKS
eukprot:CAMPEP_0171182668 /NCGR_PEP_ID=MMETSP0790-20130122/14886_1 /TAXON_ID=2925 /ORGANISM="Alexandrium catenella, Strain OF101" /LENGTH=280 /DNA_ID=CAMNT_0011647629 /DNA_START=50 /DNA_END=892 /DNA_ORIENTATION=+